MRALLTAVLSVVLLSFVNSASALPSSGAELIENELEVSVPERPTWGPHPSQMVPRVPALPADPAESETAMAPRSETDHVHIINDRIADGETTQKVHLSSSASGDVTVTNLMDDGSITLGYQIGESASFTSINLNDTFSISGAPNYLRFEAAGTSTVLSDDPTDALILCTDEQFDSFLRAKGYTSTIPTLDPALNDYFDDDNVATLALDTDTDPTDQLNRMLVMFELGDGTVDYQDLVFLVEFSGEVHCGEFHFSQWAGSGVQQALDTYFTKSVQLASHSSGKLGIVWNHYDGRPDPSHHRISACIADGPYPNLAACQRSVDPVISRPVGSGEDSTTIDLALSGGNIHAIVWTVDDATSPPHPCSGGLEPSRRYISISFTLDNGANWSTPTELFRGCLEDSHSIGTSVAVPDDVDAAFNDDGDLAILLNTYTDYSGGTVFPNEQVLLNATTLNQQSLMMLVFEHETLTDAGFDPVNLVPDETITILDGDFTIDPPTAVGPAVPGFPFYYPMHNFYYNANMFEVIGGPGDVFFASYQKKHEPTGDPDYFFTLTEQVYIYSGGTGTYVDLQEESSETWDDWFPKARRSLDGIAVSNQTAVRDVAADGTWSTRSSFTGPIFVWPVGDPTSQTLGTIMDYTTNAPLAGWDLIDAIASRIEEGGTISPPEVVSAPPLDWDHSASGLLDGTPMTDCTAASASPGVRCYHRVPWRQVNLVQWDYPMINGYAAAANNYFYAPHIFERREYVGDPEYDFVSDRDIMVVSSMRLDPPAENQAPTIETISDQVIDEGQELSFLVTAHDDISTPSLSASYPGGAFGASFVDNGNGTGTFTWAPTHLQSGTDYEVVFTANDGALDSLPESVLIDVINDETLPPTISVVVSNPNPAPGEEFTITVNGAAEAGLVAAWWGVRDLNDPGSMNIPGTVGGVVNNLAPAHDVGTCAGMDSCEYTRTISITAEGDYEVWANARDILYFHEIGVPHQASEGAGLSIVEVNVAPAFAAMPAVNPVVAGQTVSFNVTATDENGDSIRLEMLDSIPGATFTATETASTLNSESSVTGRFTWSPKTSQTGSFSVRFRATDSQGLSTISDPVKVEVKSKKPLRLPFSIFK